jgi:hypothetical protein
MATTRIEAIERKAVTEIELSCLRAQEQIALAGLTSDAARQFIEQLPSIETLMPQLSLAEMAGDAEPPIAEQLISPNALRQRRFRERQAALRNGSLALQAPSDNAAARDGKPMTTAVATDQDGAPRAAPTNDPGPMPNFLRRPPAGGGAP